MVAQLEPFHKSYIGKMAAAEEGKRQIVARVSTTTVDRDGDIMLPSGLDTEEFDQNPVMLLEHNTARLPIGRWLGIERKRNSIMAHGELARRPDDYPPGVEWLADTVFALIQQKVLRGVSVGFRIMEQGARPPNAREMEAFGKMVRRVVSRWKLFEISVCAVPANQESIITSVSKCWPNGTHLQPIWGGKRLDLTSRKLISFARRPVHFGCVACDGASLQASTVS